MPRVSVVIPTYNCSAFIGEAIESVLCQSAQDFELIIVNDGSSDRTDEVVEKYVASHGDKVLYIKKENRGHAACRNTGIKAARGEFIAFLDADDLWLADKLEMQLAVFDARPDVGFVHTNTYGFGGPDGTYVNRYWMTPEQIRKHSGNIFYEDYFRTIRITTSTVMVRKKCIVEAGLFDESLSRLGCEDRDLFLRILWKYPAVYLAEPLAKYRDRADSTGQNSDRMLKGQLYVYDKITKMFNLPHRYKKKALSAVYYEWASAYYDWFRFPEGLLAQAKSIYYNPLNYHACFMTLKMVKRFWEGVKTRRFRVS